MKKKRGCAFAHSFFDSRKKYNSINNLNIKILDKQNKLSYTLKVKLLERRNKRRYDRNREGDGLLCAIPNIRK